MPKSSRPNFLLFITDQHRADFLGCYGHPVLRTPHIDSIAARGIAFDRFYVASPVCQPNRASLMTGRMPSVHDVRSNGIPLSMNAVTFIDLLRDAGYNTALVGKSHLQNFTDWEPIVKRPKPREGFREPSSPLAQSLRDHLAEAKYEQETPGYWKNEEKNKEAFFYKEYAGVPTIFYKTGDLCLADTDGDIMYLGRIDSQIKVQGFRVELSEIEFFAKEHLQKINAVAVAFANKIGNTEIGMVIEADDFDVKELLAYMKKCLFDFYLPLLPYLPVNRVSMLYVN